MRNYWNQLAQVIPDETCHVWRQLDTDYNTMRELLAKRASTTAEVDSLAQRNTELKRLLNQYLGDQTTNAALQVPPAQVMKVKNVAPALGRTGKVGPPARGDKNGNQALFSQTR